MLTWFDRRSDFEAMAREIAIYRHASEDYLSSRSDWQGYCHVGGKMERMTVDSGARFGERPNLREGLICECGLSNRNRLLLNACQSRRVFDDDARVTLLEASGPLFQAFVRRSKQLTATEYVDDGLVPGSRLTVAGFEVRHETLENLSHPSSSVDFLIHSDVLEHVPDTRRAVRESARVLARGGWTIFTCPFFMTREQSGQLAQKGRDGSIEYLSPPEYHGDPRRPEGVLTFHHFGWSLVDLLKTSFRSVLIGVHYDPFSGLVSNFHPSDEYGNMLPIVFAARK